MSSNVIEDAVNVFTDGSSISKPRRQGGAALRIVVIDESGNEEVRDVPLAGFRQATNQQMELYACIQGIKEAERHPALGRMRRIAIHTDSMYVVGNYDRARFDWSRNGWRNCYGKAISNAPRWKELVKIGTHAPKKVEFHWTKGHAKDEHNKAVDRMAREVARAASRSQLSIVNVRRKTTEKSVELGSVGVYGQRLTIKVIADEYLFLQRCYKYKYEVVSPKSPYRGSVDIVFSSELMSAGHTYYILLNNDPRNPTIVKVIREVTSRAPAKLSSPNASPNLIIDRHEECERRKASKDPATISSRNGHFQPRSREGSRLDHLLPSVAGLPAHVFTLRARLVICRTAGSVGHAGHPCQDRLATCDIVGG